MNKKKYLAFAVVFAVLAVLLYLQFRTWRNFDWALLLQYKLNWRHILHGVGYIYLAYFLRAVRWKIFLRPVRKHASIMGLIPPTLIGFTGLALLGRPGEMIRPYLIARRENLTFSSQVAVWLVERIFDMASVAVMFVVAGFAGDPLWDTLPNQNLSHEVRWSAGLFLCGIVVLAAVAVVLRRSGYA